MGNERHVATVSLKKKTKRKKKVCGGGEAAAGKSLFHLVSCSRISHCSVDKQVHERVCLHVFFFFLFFFL